MSLREADGYDAFAFAYDQALGKPFFSALSRRLEDLIARFPREQVRHLDVACGTGLLLEWSSRRGWDSSGVDASLTMLDLARDRSKRVICADMRSLPVTRVLFDRVTCMYDSLNHLLTEEHLVAAFRCVRSVLRPDGMFWFDLNHPDAYEAVWADDEPFTSLGDDWDLTISTSFDRRRQLATAHVKGHADVRNHRVFIDEVHTQRPWTDAAVRRALREAGLQTAWRTRFEPFGSGGERDGLKVLYAVEIAGGE